MNLKGQGQWPSFSIPAESIPGGMFGANLVVPAQMCDDRVDNVKFMDGRMDGQTDGQTDAGNINTPSAWT